MQKNTFIKGTIILILGGFITKLLGMVIKIITTRLLTVEGMGLYMLIMPSFMLLITFAQLGFPVAISKLVAEDKRNNKNLVFSIIPVSLVINFSIMLLLFIFGDFIANNLLQDKRAYYPILSIGLVLPFISISSILRGYFFGKSRMFPHVISNITEDVIRLIIIATCIPLFIIKGLEFAVTFLVLSNIISELTSILVLFLFLPKKFSFHIKDFKLNKKNVKDILNISIPTTSSRIIGNIGYFFEPIILMFFLTKNGYSQNYIISEYGILTGYVIPLLLLPSFFTAAISSSLIPIISKSYVDNKINYIKTKIKQAIFISLLIGIPISLFFTFFPEIPLRFVFNTTMGKNYLKFLAPIFIFLYIQTPISSSLQAIGKATSSMKGTLYGMIIKTILLIVFTNLSFGLWSLVISSCTNILFITFYDFLKLKKYLNQFP